MPVVPHNSLTCPVRLANENEGAKGARKKKPLMDLVDRRQGKGRIQGLIGYFDEFCSLNNEVKKDVLAFEYRRELNNRGKYRAAKTFDSFHHKPSQILVKPSHQENLPAELSRLGSLGTVLVTIMPTWSSKVFQFGQLPEKLICTGGNRVQ